MWRCSFSHHGLNTRFGGLVFSCYSCSTVAWMTCFFWLQARGSPVPKIQPIGSNWFHYPKISNTANWIQLVSLSQVWLKTRKHWSTTKEFYWISMKSQLIKSTRRSSKHPWNTATAPKRSAALSNGNLSARVSLYSKPQQRKDRLGICLL